MAGKVEFPRITKESIERVLDEFDPDEARKQVLREQPILCDSYLRSFGKDEGVTMIAVVAMTLNALKIQMEKGE
jgi:hypothetical protein